ncbi:membrane integrity-associated transporter subunit PqiC [Tropicimonas sp. IMCC6043]|uniref:PqiC family protein n=1 Tax=Tropicimonas sp. IMCC6043 TaxID=2510645 RepID=UPI00101B986F|nr:ABC-type transport auxiliary lipoprotein family protein [Tropicimonas sp. IMCC6043]RYH08949.1 hypothetical protein EU800_14550 [Tropicimonas sp. IMCC6043]
MRLTLCLVALLAGLAACGPAPMRYAAPQVASGDRISIGVSRLEVREVSLPTYAQGEEIWRETESGAIESDPKSLWADDPARGVTLELSRHLAALSGAKVAAEPWPFEDLPQARLFVRVEEMVAGSDAVFRMSGQYFIARLTGGREVSGTFAVRAPIGGDGSPQAIAAARATAVRDLARLIAGRGF